MGLLPDMQTCELCMLRYAVMHAGIANQRFPLKSVVEKNMPGIPGACATRYFTYLVRGLLKNLLHDWYFIWGGTHQWIPLTKAQ